MRRCIPVLAGLAIVGALALPAALAQEAKAVEAVEVRPAKPRGEAKERRGKADDPFGKGAAGGAGATFGEDLDALTTQLALTEDQKKKIEALKTSRDKALERWDKVNQPKLEAAQSRLERLPAGERRDPRVADMRRRLQAGIRSLQASRAKLAGGYERRMFAVLKPEQKAKWNAPILKEEMTKRFSLLFLEAKQTERLETLCSAQGRRLAVPLNVESEAHAKLIQSVEVQVFRSILNSKQKIEYRKLKASQNPRNRERGRERARGR